MYITSQKKKSVRQIWDGSGGRSCLGFPVRGVLLYQSLKMIENKDLPRENPSPKRKASPSNMPRPWRMRGLQLVDRWRSRPREPFAGLTKWPRSAGQKEVSCAGLRGPARD